MEAMAPIDGFEQVHRHPRRAERPGPREVCASQVVSAAQVVLPPPAGAQPRATTPSPWELGRARRG